MSVSYAKRIKCSHIELKTWYNFQIKIKIMSEWCFELSHICEEALNTQQRWKNIAKKWYLCSIFSLKKCVLLLSIVLNFQIIIAINWQCKKVGTDIESHALGKSYPSLNYTTQLCVFRGEGYILSNNSAMLQSKLTIFIPWRAYYNPSNLWLKLVL